MRGVAAARAGGLPARMSSAGRAFWRLMPARSAAAYDFEISRSIGTRRPLADRRDIRRDPHRRASWPRLEMQRGGRSGASSGSGNPSRMLASRPDARRRRRAAASTRCRAAIAARTVRALSTAIVFEVAACHLSPAARAARRSRPRSARYRRRARRRRAIASSGRPRSDCTSRCGRPERGAIGFQENAAEDGQRASRGCARAATRRDRPRSESLRAPAGSPARSGRRA